MEPSKAVKEYKEEIDKLNITVGEYAKKVGQLTLEKDWAVGKLQSLDSSDRKNMIESELKTLSVVKQCGLLNLSRSGLYYTPTISESKLAIKKEIESIFEDVTDYMEFYNYRRFHETLKYKKPKYKTAESNNGKLDILHMSNIPVKLPINNHGEIDIKIQNLIKKIKKIFNIKTNLEKILVKCNEKLDI